MSVSNDLSVFAFFRFSVRDDPKTEEPIDWLKNRATAKALIDAVMSVPLFSDGLKVGRADDDDFAKITAKTAGALVGKKGEVAVELQDREDDRNLFVRASLNEGTIEVRIDISAAGLANRGAATIDDLVSVGQRMWKAMQGTAGLDVGHVQFDFATRIVDYPRARPPRGSNAYPANSLVTFIDCAFHDTSDAFARKGDPEKLTSPPPPAPAKMSKDGDLVVVRWTSSLEDRDLIAAAAGHDKWITERVDTQIGAGWNELGDQLDDRGHGKAHPPLTFYVPRQRTGYKAVLVTPDGELEEDSWNEAVKIAKAKKLPDGTPVEWLKIVVPLRKHVAMVADKAKQAGIAAVLYPDDRGGFWDPNPPGNWLPASVKGAK